MDRVRFGRALGYGARHAAKAVVKAVDAASAPNPANTGHGATRQPRTAATPAARSTVESAGPAKAAEFRTSGASSGAGSSEARSGSFGRAPSQTARVGVGDRLTQAQVVVRHGKKQVGHLRRHMWSPLAKFSGVVWLQVTGTFFALVAAYLSQGLWKDRGTVHLPINSPGAGTFYLHVVAFAIFVYFAVSSFVRAHLRQRR